MHLIVGLGNPGSKYVNTRHNVGFLVLDEIAKYFNVFFKPGKGNFWLANCSLNEKEIVILKPSTYMNESGIAVQEHLEQSNIPLENVLIVCDDFQLPLGKVRLRRSGSDGGHNGLASVIYHLRTEDIARLRCGIASENMPSDKIFMKDYVLEYFLESEIPIVNKMLLRARDACLTSVRNGIESAMNQFNANTEENLINPART